MIDSTTETLISFSEASDRSPRRGRGRKIHISTFYRWATIGCRGIVLETIQVGGSRCTSVEALDRFFQRLSQSRQAGPVGGGQAGPGVGRRTRTLAQSQRASAEAGRKLVKQRA
jgi:hypothetical protein